ncbi:MAG TPA: amino acid transporter [Candidatus Magasanikbacteria bacterium]|nr:amino acid transporter [Candidatus Magasanikbacteria bacterium]
MEYITLIGVVVGIHILGVISPGPDFIMVVKNSLAYSRKSGIWTAIGLGIGISVHIFYCLMGLAFIISKSILVFNAIKLLGAGYLIYIGWKSWKSKSSVIEIDSEEQKRNLSIFASIKMGFLTNILNPKVTLLFLSLFSLVIPPETPMYVLTILSVILISNTIIWFSIVATLFTQKKVRLLFGRYQRLFNKTFGGILIALGLKVALSSK